MPNKTYSFVINAWYYQFYLEDANAHPAYDALWTQHTYEDRAAAGPGIIAVGTARYGVGIPLLIEVRDSEPALEAYPEWEHVVECSIRVASGCLQLTNPNSFGTGVPQIDIAPGTYRARIYYAKLDSIRGGGDLDGDDYYRIVLWPGSTIEPVVLKRKPTP
jgi:hypothetical protein